MWGKSQKWWCGAGAAALLLRDMWSQDVMVIVRGGEVLRWGSASVFHDMEENLG